MAKIQIRSLTVALALFWASFTSLSLTLEGTSCSRSTGTERHNKKPSKPLATLGAVSRWLRSLRFRVSSEIPHNPEATFDVEAKLLLAHIFLDRRLP